MSDLDPIKNELAAFKAKIPEVIRLLEDARREKNWKRWGPYLSERQWGTVREDYSRGGDCWNSFPHDHARSRAYRWGEDGLLGLTGPEGNHGEDVKECYFHLDSTPTDSYMKALYKYPQAEYPYTRLVEENRRRSKAEPEYELIDTGVFDRSKPLPTGGHLEQADGTAWMAFYATTMMSMGVRHPSRCAPWSGRSR